jgi:hypothetical protein
MTRPTSRNKTPEEVPAPYARWILETRSPYVLHSRRTQDAISRVVGEVWERNIWAPFWPLIAARLPYIRLVAGSRIYWRHHGQHLTLTVTEWTPGDEWEMEIRYAVGHLLMYALFLEAAALAAGITAETGALGGDRQGTPAGVWARAFQHPSGRQIMRQMAAALIKPCGLYPPNPRIDVSSPPTSDTDLTYDWTAEARGWYDEEDDPCDGGEDMYVYDGDDRDDDSLGDV